MADRVSSRKLFAARMSVREGAPAEIWETPPPGVVVRNPYFEPTPLDLVASVISDIGVVGTVHEGRVFPLKDAARRTASYRLPENWRPIASLSVSSEHSHSHNQGGCACSTGRFFAEQMFPPIR